MNGCLKQWEPSSNKHHSLKDPDSQDQMNHTMKNNIKVSLREIGYSDLA